MLRRHDDRAGDAAPSDDAGHAQADNGGVAYRETVVNRQSVSCRIALLAPLLALSSVVAQAQTAAKQPRQLPPPAAQVNGVPAGVDTGTPAGSDSVPLGTPVMSGAPTNRATFKAESAAARAAGRPKPAASAASSAKGTSVPALSASDVAASRPASPLKP